MTSLGQVPEARAGASGGSIWEKMKSGDAPVDVEPGIKDGNGTIAAFDLVRVCDDIAFGERDRLLVYRQAVETGAIARGEGFELVECIGFFEHLGQQ